MKFSIGFTDILLISPLILIFLFSLIPITKKALSQNQEPSHFYSITLPSLGIISSLLIGFLFVTYRLIPEEGVFIFSKALLINGQSLFSFFTISTLTLCTLLLAGENSLLRQRFSEWVFLLLNSCLGMIIFTWSAELLVSFIGLELFSFSLYVMIVLNSEKTLSKEAAIKYFILGSLASAFFVYGISFLYGTAGSSYLHEIAQNAATFSEISRIFLIGVCLVFMGLLFKVAAFPFHWWVPDVYHGSSSPLTGFMATSVKIASFVFFLKFISLGFLSSNPTFEILFMWLIVLTMLVGNGAALLQNNMKRMLAYSSIAHSGYLLMGVLSYGKGIDTASSSVLFYLLGYMFAVLGLFSVLNLLESKDRLHIDFDDLKGLSHSHPYLAFSITIFTLSLIGLPLTSGFFGKFFLLDSVLKGKLYWLSFWAVLNSVLSAYYYLKPSILMYMKEEETPYPIRKSPHTQSLILVSLVMVMTLGFFAEPFYRLIRYL